VHRKTKIEPKLSLFDSIELVNTDHWNSVVGNKNIYLTIPYLMALEKALKDTIDFRYTIFYDDFLRPIAVSYNQILQYVNNDTKYKDVLCHLGDKLKNHLIGAIGARVLICGNVFAGGENGFAYKEDLTDKEAFKILAHSMKRLSQEKEKNGSISFGILKDFWPDSFRKADHLFDSNFKGFMIDVNMVMAVRASWRTMDDYLASMTAKYRTRAKSVYKKSAQLEEKELTLEEIVLHQNRIEALYREVLNQAEFKFGELNAQAFVNFKAYLKEKFVLKAYFLEGKMIGFSTLFLCNKLGDANYVGIDYEYNKEHAVYQRMLYDLVDFSIRYGIEELRLGRTAEQIKSSIGAEPVNMKLYMRHRNSFSNTLIGPIISAISPSPYELRPPFKKELA